MIYNKNNKLTHKPQAKFKYLYKFGNNLDIRRRS